MDQCDKTPAAATRPKAQGWHFLDRKDDSSQPTASKSKRPAWRSQSGPRSPTTVGRQDVAIKLMC